MVRTRLRRRLGASVLLAALALVPVAAVATTTGDAAAVAAGRTDGSLPPSARKDLVAIFGPKVRRFGLRVTRAALVDATQHRDPQGTHLAIYVEPTGEYTPQDYVDGTVDVTRVFLPSVFTRWKALRSFDVCQEPSPAVDDRPTPAPETQVFASRGAAGSIDWWTADVATLVARSDVEAAAGSGRPVAFSVYLAAHLKNTPAYREAVGTGTPSGSTSAPPTTHGYG
jgi:hypothetical protein